jgi:hypothetical protein
MTATKFSVFTNHFSAAYYPVKLPPTSAYTRGQAYTRGHSSPAGGMPISWIHPWNTRGHSSPAGGMPISDLAGHSRQAGEVFL